MSRWKKKPKIRAIWLGKALAEIRTDAGLTAKEVAAYVQRDASMISRMEDGLIPVSEEILEGYMEMCGISDPHRRADLMTIRQDASQSGWWDGYKRDVASGLMDLAWMESKAVVIRSFDIAYFPGLLQTPRYAEAVMRAVKPAASDRDLARWVEVRMTRQHILQKHDPVTLDCILDQQLLPRIAGTKEILREQLDHLIDIISTRPNITVRVLPNDRYVGTLGAFELFELVAPYPEVAYVATPAGDVCVEGEAIGLMSEAYDRFQGASLEPEASLDLIIAERDKL